MIDDYVASAALATVATLPFTPEEALDAWYIYPIRRDTAPTGASLRSGLGLASANLDTQIADIEGKVDDLETRLGTPSDLGSGATVAANLADIEGFADSIPTDVWANGTRTLTAIDEDSTTLDLDATIRGAVGLAAADLDTQLAALPTAAENADAVWDEAATATPTQAKRANSCGEVSMPAG
ncbi:MAG: hypothetical protein IPL72_17300 [Sulfuritalea sp.]|nr:hypothetical protein [Sulfuritalea sp.]